MKHVYLFNTSHCHLCEAAHALIINILELNQFTMIEIADDETLLARYGLKIPVLQRQDNFAELAWPFDEAAIRNFLK